MYSKFRTAGSHMFCMLKLRVHTHGAKVFPATSVCYHVVGVPLFFCVLRYLVRKSRFGIRNVIARHGAMVRTIYSLRLQCFAPAP
jgi:hypothetical protein